MPTLTKEQVRHKVINLSKTLQLLERSMDERDLKKQATEDMDSRWLEAQSNLAGIHLCRNILSSVSPNDYDHGIGDHRSLSGQQFHNETKALLDRLERWMVDSCQELKPQPRRRKSILQLVPRSTVLSEVNHGVIETMGEDAQEMVPNEKAGPVALNGSLIPASDLEARGHPEIASDNSQVFLTPKSEQPTGVSADKVSTLLPSSPAAQSATVPEPIKTLDFLQSSTVLHEELSDQLARMAKQLRSNAEHFSSSLEKDKDVTQSLEEKLERNYDTIMKERVRLRDHGSKSGGTTCLVLFSIFVVIVGFMLSFFVIRIT